ncbi:MAG: macrocin O-methyltransferase [Actinobacteria bacterium]|nr:macrocin O-methyltransferase [Actinomycetota bacterium]
MTSPERVLSTIETTKYIVKYGIEGAIVECGVWKGGSAMAMALTLNELGHNQRDIYLYDTFSGMNAPTEADVTYKGVQAHKQFSEERISADSSDWCLSPIEEVKKNVYSTGYPSDRFHFVEGKVEDTISEQAPERIALLRLDTDWYESTKHELTHLFPRVSPMGVIIIDDYGYWQGARQAVDEYISENDLRLFLHRIDYTGRLVIKMP